jgi:hypothetical protein
MVWYENSDVELYEKICIRALRIQENRIEEQQR